MAAIPATITVNFISNYAGPHRVCWRIGSSGSYNCTTVVTCIGGGNPCQAIISTTVDNETCDEVNFNGYTQAGCESEGSTNGRDPFSVTFTPTPTCQSYNVLCASVGVDTITVTEGGSGYDPLTPPAVTITGDGSGAAATAIVGDGGIVDTVSINAGSGYVDGDYTAVPAVNLTGTGTGATFDVAVISGVVVGIAVNTPGTGYAIGDTFEFDNTNLGGTGSGVVFEVLTLDTGIVIAINVTVAGTGYSSIATISIEPPITSPGTQAEAEAVMETCGTYTISAGCDGVTSSSLSDFSVGQSINVCSPLDLTDSSPTNGYEVVQDGCCYDCIYITVTKGSKDGDGTLYYTDCTTRLLTEVAITEGTVSFCVVNNSYTVVEDLPDNNTTISISTTCP